MRVGSGDFVYEVIHDWGKLPAGWEFGAVPDGRVDSQGRVFVFTRSAHPVLVLDTDGAFQYTWGHDIFNDAHGIFIGPDDLLYCADDKDHTVRKCTADGKILMTLGRPNQPSDSGYDGKDWKTIQRGAPPFNRPTSVGLGPQGEIYVSDGYGNARMHKFSADGKLLGSWGGPGDGPGQFAIVHTCCVDANGTVYVSDRENDRIQIFDANGQFITQWTNMHRPNGMFIGPDGLLYVSELFANAGWRGGPVQPAQISIWKLDGTLLARWGGEDYTLESNFFAPHGLWGDSQGNLYVGELAISSHRGPRPAGYPAIHKLVRV
jgi:DNA-binding beta-propeller fold protein YncE